MGILSFFIRNFRRFFTRAKTIYFAFVASFGITMWIWITWKYEAVGNSNLSCLCIYHVFVWQIHRVCFLIHMLFLQIKMCYCNAVSSLILILGLVFNIGDALHGFVPFVQFEKREKHRWRIVIFIACNFTKSNTPPWVFFTI